MVLSWKEQCAGPLDRKEEPCVNKSGLILKMNETVNIIIVGAKSFLMVECLCTAGLSSCSHALFFELMSFMSNNDLGKITTGAVMGLHLE